MCIFAVCACVWPVRVFCGNDKVSCNVSVHLCGRYNFPSLHKFSRWFHVVARSSSSAIRTEKQGTSWNELHTMQCIQFQFHSSRNDSTMKTSSMYRKMSIELLDEERDFLPFKTILGLLFIAFLTVVLLSQGENTNRNTRAHHLSNPVENRKLPIMQMLQNVAIISTNGLQRRKHTMNDGQFHRYSCGTETEPNTHTHSIQPGNSQFNAVEQWCPNHPPEHSVWFHSLFVHSFNASTKTPRKEIEQKPKHSPCVIASVAWPSIETLRTRSNWYSSELNWINVVCVTRKRWF